MIPGSVRSKIIINSTVVLLILTLATLYTGLASGTLTRSVEVLFRNNLRIEGLVDALSATEASLERYLTNKGSDDLREYIRESTLLADRARVLDRRVVDNPTALQLRLLAGLVDRFLADAGAAVEAKRGRDVAAYALSFDEASLDAELAREAAGALEGSYVSDSLKAFDSFRAGISATLASNAALVLAATLLSFTILVRYTFRLTEPLTRLAEAARAVGRGEYDHELPAIPGGDEIATTAAAFSSMVRSVKAAFHELRSKAQIEKSLMEERVRLLDLDHKLKDAELLALQTQINPHFLFNTLSAGQQLALTEDASRTVDFLENLAAFIRYTLKTPARSVFIRDELECTERYMWLLRLRFGQRFSFRVDADQEALGVRTPALIIQPLVENAVTHGLRNREAGGVVTVKVTGTDTEARIDVSDTGDGMTPADLDRILSEAEDPSPDSGALEGGIGLKNVIRRVSLATGGAGRVEIRSEPGAGTTVSVFLPAFGGDA